jgi:glycerol kinase
MMIKGFINFLNFLQNHLRATMAEFFPPLVGAIDQGTQSSRFIVFDSKAAVVASFQKSHKQIIPQPGWCEHNPVRIRPYRAP